jgi:methionine-rich copper-binding protein CopC
LPGPAAAGRHGWAVSSWHRHALLLILPATASAHAVPVSSTPAPGARLGVAPGAVVIVFDEPLEPRLSGTTVIDPTGRRFTGTVSGKTIRVPLSTNAPGVYQVDWKTVSVVDGHTITGTFQFGVGVSPAWQPRPPGPPRRGRRRATFLSLSCAGSSTPCFCSPAGSRR